MESPHKLQRNSTGRGTWKRDQKVKIFGCGFFEGTVVRVIPSGVEVESFGLLAQFDNMGQETEDSRFRRAGGLKSWGPEWQLWELAEFYEENQFNDNGVAVFVTSKKKTEE
jgi:hypothetical protein